VAEGSPTPTPTPTPTGVRVRQDIWDLGDTANPWRDPAILAYALAVKAMQDLDTTNPNNGTSWINQAAIHKRNFGVAQDAGKLQDQCQHNCWYFLPWHRMYIFSFEEIVRSHMAADVARTWALPYWNYSDDPRRRALPPAFRERNLPASAGGGPNPLFVSRRQVSPIDINAGGDLGSETVELVNAMAPALFSRALPTPTQGFGGGDVGRTNHDRAGARGPLEGTPHGNVHVVVGGEAPDGLMTQFETAALDPIFWLHHSNIDRLWEAWRRGSNGGHGPGANPTQSTWLTQRFDFFDTTGSRVSRKAEDALDIERQLSYTYSNLPATFAPASDRDVELRPASVSDEQPPEMVGATEEPLTLNGLTQSTRMQVSAPLRPAGSDVGGGPQEPEHVYLSIDNVEGERNPGLVYSVFVNLPEGEPPEHPSPYFAGSMSFFGIEHSAAGAGDGGDEAPHSMQYGFDITPIVAQLKEEGRWDPGQLDVTITALAAPDEELAKREIPPVQIGRISLYVE
jgi:tyrosinase